MLKIGLTGGIACGKSLVADYFRQLNITVLDSDQIARQLVEPHQPALQAIIHHFGSICLNEQGHLNRTWMRQKVFSNPKKLATLEAILHPEIRANLKNQVENCHNSDTKNTYIVLDIPLLIEKSFTDLVDRILVVDCLPSQQLERATERDNSSLSRIKQIMQMQASRQKQLSMANDIIDNTGKKTELHSQIKALHKKYTDIYPR